MLDVRLVSRFFGDFKAVDDVTFSVNQGEIVGLLGQNGAGKTTIMKMLTAYLEPDTGSIEFNGVNIAEDSTELRRELGYLPENLPVYPELSIASYLDYAAELKGFHGASKRQAIRQVVEATDLGSRLLSPIATLSRGLKQRVGVAQAILGEPSILILDEPTNGLDPAQTEQMRQLIRTLSQSATVILSTHIMQEVEAICDRALIVRQGRLAVDARLAELTQGSRIRLRTDAKAGAIDQALKALSVLQSVRSMKYSGDYLLDIATDEDIDSVIAQCVRMLVDANIAVMSIQSDRRDLQSLFLEVNAEQSAAASAEPSGAESEINHVA